MSGQFEFNLEPRKETSLESLSLEELREKYYAYIGVSSRLTSTERETILEALSKPKEEELNRLRKLDMEEDQDDRRNRR